MSESEPRERTKPEAKPEPEPDPEPEPEPAAPPRRWVPDGIARLADRPVPQRPAAAIYGLLLLCCAAVGDPLAYGFYDTIERVPAARAALVEHADPEPVDPPPPTRRAIVVLVDGLRLDESRRMGALDLLRDEGIDAIAQVPLPTLSRPFYHSMLTGVPNDGSGLRNNAAGMKAVFDSLADRVRAAGGRVAWVADQLNWVALMHGRKGDLFLHGEHATGPALDRVLSSVVREDGPALTVIHLLGVDETAHDCGSQCSPHLSAVDFADDVIGRVGDRALSRDVIAVLSDHGHIDAGGHGGDETGVRTVPFVVRAPGLRGRTMSRVVRAEEIAPTLAALIGVAPPRSATGGPVREIADAGPARGVVRRARLLDQATARARDEHGRARVLWLAGVLVLALCALGATKRAFGGWSRPSWLAPLLLVALVVLVHVAAWGRPISMSAIDRIARHGPRLVVLGASAAFVALAICAMADEPWARRPSLARIRRGAAAIGWTAITCAALAIGQAGGALGPWPLSAPAYYLPILTIAAGAGACGVAGLVLVVSAALRSPIPSGSPEK